MLTPVGPFQGSIFQGTYLTISSFKHRGCIYFRLVMSRMLNPVWFSSGSQWGVSSSLFDLEAQQGSEVFNVPYCHSFGFHIHWSYLFPLLWAEIRWVILLPSVCLLQSGPEWDFCISLTCMHGDTSVYLCVALCHEAITATHTHTHMGLVKTRPITQSPGGEAWVWAPSSWQQEATTLITGWLLNYREQRSFFPRGARLAENE